MNGSKRWTVDSVMMRMSILVCTLAFAAALWPGAASGVTVKSSVLGPHAEIDSATDDGGGRIRVSWSLSTPAPDEEYSISQPDKVCVFWREVENGVLKPATRKCFTSEVSTQADLVVDSGIGDDVPSAVYRVHITAYYHNSLPMYPVDGLEYLNVTVKGQG